MIYIYKSKGTLNSVDALLNIYGYPPGSVGMQEFGGSTEEHDLTVLTDDISNTLLGNMSGNISYILRKVF